MRTVFPSFLSAFDQLSWLLLALFTSCIVLGSADTNQTSWPLYPKKPVIFVWNAPTQNCETRRGVKLSLDQFDIVSTPTQGVVGQALTLFYKERLGIYPYYDTKDTEVNGGIPQSVSLSQHLEKMSKDLDTYIPDRKAKGMCVIDWEEWRPLWVRNWSGKDIYRRKSRELLAKKNSTLTQGQVATAAKEEFELSARQFMQETLKQGKNLRPNQLWGFYLFPDCYNHNYKGKMDSFTGRCPDVEYERNDELNWLWNESTALFPSIYLDPDLRSTDQARLFVLNRVKEAMRLASVGDGLARPVFVYSQPTFRDVMTLLTEVDLVSTIGESVALGAAGVIFWGGSSYASSSGCSDLNNYFRGPMGRYLLNVTTAAKECSQKLCKFNGRCLRRAPDSAVFLHLSPTTHKIISQSGKLKVRGSPGQAELKAFRQHFKCQCYNGTKGEGCEWRGKGGKGEREQSGATSVLGMWPLCFVLQLGLLSLFH
uniref:Hyaluronidase n=1 Tax=Poecilia latipinna TaxID=48699 RepID=A0A3B3U3K3_9TELE